ncbi:flavodoxin family protein [Desulfurobacterium sp.]
MRVAILYWSGTGNTRRLVNVLLELMENFLCEFTVIEIKSKLDFNPLEYDVVIFGIPVYRFLPPKEVISFIEHNMDKFKYLRKLRSPKVPFKFGVTFCTYSGIHTGIKEAIPAVKYVSQFLEHFGYLVVDELYVLCRFNGWDEANINGKCGVIADLPDNRTISNFREDMQDWFMYFMEVFHGR